MPVIPAIDLDAILGPHATDPASAVRDLVLVDEEGDDARGHAVRVGLGILLTMTGGMRDGSMVMQGPLQYLVDRRMTVLRGTWSALPDGRVRQRFEESTDDGKTWTEWFDGYYTRQTGTRQTGTRAQ